jgi:hypothetical protein|tara:strand:- start:319 stop:753 length:435 start_codon:yes stop_codon:yes gene_type:complete
MKKYQQGDVLIVEIDEKRMKELEKESSSDSGPTESITSANGEPVVLAFGEATGHSHQIKPKKGDVINHFHNSRIDYTVPFNYATMKDGRPRILEDEAKALQIIADEVTIYHEEHNPITVPRGNYEVRIVREFNHMTQRIQRVWD